MDLQQIGQLLSEQQLATNQSGPEGEGQMANDPCGPEPPRPNYYSPQGVRDRYNAWKMCKAGA